MNAINIQDLTKPFTHRATLNGTSVEFHADDYDRVIGEFVQKNGGGVPKVERLNADSIVAEAHAPMPKLLVGQYDAEGDARSARDRAAAKAAGFSPKNPVYRQGLRAEGMKRHRDAFDQLPDARHAATRLIVQVEGEHRQNVKVLGRDIRMNEQGRLAFNGTRTRLTLSERGFQQVTARLGMPSGAAGYLEALAPKFRALNVNSWVTEQFADAQAIEAQEAYQATPPRKFKPLELVVRTRDLAGHDGDGTREAFAVVSGGYGEYDADKIAAAIRLAVPENARARVAYDGYRTKFDVVFFSNVPVEQAVAGEFFQAAVQVRTSDDGGGSIVVSAAIHQNLCLNFIILDKAVGEVARIRHIGSVEKLAEKFREAFASALKKIEHFTKAWGYAQEEPAHVRALVTAKQTGQITAEDFESYSTRPISEMLPGIFNGLIERELVPLPKKNRQATVDALMAMWAKDESYATRARETFLPRAAVVNALTRYAHEVNEDDFAATELEAAAGALLASKPGAEPAPLPFVPLKAKTPAS